jgi:N,N-dimethylformamidase beta subunit-like, C-terminal/Concanavalin A-like lectin/glucanases superfamily
MASHQRGTDRVPDPAVPEADWDVVVGYADRLSAKPGSRLQMMVSCASDLEAEVVRLPSHEPGPITITRLREPFMQEVHTGAHVTVEHHASLRPDDGLAVSVGVWLAPGAKGGERRALLASWGPEGADGWALVIDADGRPGFEVAVGGRRWRAVGTTPVPLDTWWRLEGRLDAASGELSVARRNLAGVTIDRGVGSLAADAPGPGPGPMIIGAEQPGSEARVRSHFEGKLEDPRVAAGPGATREVAAWDLGAGRTRQVPDRGPHGLDGTCVNGPMRAVTGSRWTGDIHDWRWAPEGYEAMYLHADAVDDLAWEPVLELEIAESCPSGVYAIVLRSGQHEDLVPFIVRRPVGTPPAPTAVLLPTFTYLAYSCERAAPAAAGSDQAIDRWVADHGLRCLYDRFEDGSGVYEASILRPLTQLRPGYRCAQHGGPHGLAQDLILLGFLERRGIDADLLTDHDLHGEGVAALASHRAVVTGAHPEYATGELIEALEAFVDGGGGLAYLGGNGLNGRVSVDPDRPHVLEVRRTETQGLVWQALPGEHHHASTGGYGGDWRRQGHPEHRFLGVGLSAFGSGEAAPYLRVGVIDPGAAKVFAGLDPDVPIGHGGAVLGGAAGFEVDNHDPLLGSPDDATLLASATMGEGYDVWPDDVRDTPAAQHKHRADMVLRRPPGGGTVFAVGSIAWTGCLEADDDNPVARVTENVLRELAGDARSFSDDAG